MNSDEFKDRNNDSSTIASIKDILSYLVDAASAVKKHGWDVLEYMRIPTEYTKDVYETLSVESRDYINSKCLVSYCDCDLVIIKPYLKADSNNYVKGIGIMGSKCSKCIKKAEEEAEKRYSDYKCHQCNTVYKRQTGAIICQKCLRSYAMFIRTIKIDKDE